MLNKYVFTAVLFSAFCCTPLFGQSYSSFNQSSNKAKSSLGLKPKAPTSSAKQVDVTASADNGYVAGATHNLYFTFIINNTDFEYGDSLSMTFPAGITVNSVSNNDIFGPAFDPGGAPEEFNGIDGQVISWGDNDNDYGGITSQGNIYTFSVNASFDGGLSGDQSIEVHISGDTFGESPGDQDLTITLAEDSNPEAQIQIIHNSSDLAAGIVDVRIDGMFTDPSLDDLNFRTASPYFSIAAATDVTITVNPNDSSDDLMPLYSEVVNLDPGVSYQIVAGGIISDSGYEPLTPFAFDVFSPARQDAEDVDFTDVLVYHGSTDAPTVNVSEPFFGAQLVSELSYSESQGYIPLPTENYTLEVTLENGTTINNYSAPLLDLGLTDQAITVLASGFVDPSLNSDGSSFGLWVALPAGGSLVELEVSSLAQVQVIHNSADLAAEFVDIRINGELSPIFDDFPFRTASPFISVSTIDPIVITVNEPTSADDSNPLYTIDLTGLVDPNQKYILLAEGIISDVGYTPDALLAPFEIRVIENVREGADSFGNVDVLVLHSSTDAPTIDINELTVPVDGLIEDFSYGETEGYFELATENYAFQLVNSEDDSEIASYSAPLQNLGLENRAISVIASGFVSPFDNQDGPGFGLWVALPTGGPLTELGLFSLNDFPCNAISVSTDGSPVFGSNIGATIDDGEVVPPDGDCSAFDGWCDGNGELAQLDNSLWYSFVAPASGVVELTTCLEETNFDTQIAVWSSNDCDDYSTYELVGANDDFDTDIECASPNPYASFLIICGLNEGQEYYVQIDGYNGSIGNFGLSISEMDAFTCSARLQVVNNSADMQAGIVDFRINGEFVADDHDDLAFRNSTATIDVPAGGSVNLSVNPSTSVDDSEALLILEDVVFEPGGSYQIVIQGISSDFGYDPGNTMAPLDLLIIDGFEETNPNDNNTSIAVVHGSTDAPTIDLDELFEFDAEIIGNLQYTSAAGYINLPTGNYSLGITLAGEDDVLAAYYAPLEDLGLGATAITIFASGFFDPVPNSNGPEFGLWASVPDGGELIPFQVVTSVIENSELQNFKIFPNPASNVLNLTFDMVSSNNVRFEIYDLSGRVLSSQAKGAPATGSHTENIDISGLSSGYYIMSVIVDNERMNSPFQVIK